MLAASIAVTAARTAFGSGRRATGDAFRKRLPVCRRLFGNVLGKLDQRGPRFLFLCKAIGFAHATGKVVACRNLDRILGDRLHQRNDVDDLEAALLGFLDGLLTRDHQNGHAAKLCVGGRSHEVRRARAERGDADPGLAGVAAVGGCHEACALFVPRQDQLDLLRTSKRVEKIKVLFAGHAEYILAAFRLQALDQNVRGFLGISHCSPPCAGVPRVGACQQKIRFRRNQNYPKEARRSTRNNSAGEVRVLG